LVAASAGSSPPPGWNTPVTVTQRSRAGTRGPPITRTTIGAASAAQQAIW
jgi:hypothetical protein